MKISLITYTHICSLLLFLSSSLKHSNIIYKLSQRLILFNLKFQIQNQWLCYMVYIWLVTLIFQNFKMPNPLKYYNYLKYQKMKIIPKFNINDRSMGLNYFRYVLLWLELYQPQSHMFISWSPWLRMWPFLDKDLYRGDELKWVGYYRG